MGAAAGPRMSVGSIWRALQKTCSGAFDEGRRYRLRRREAPATGAALRCPDRAQAIAATALSRACRTVLKDEFAGMPLMMCRSALVAGRVRSRV